MKLAEALGVKDGDVVAFVGAGGKTTAMFRLARELCAAGKRVVVTTTTRIRDPGREFRTVQAEDRERLRARVVEALNQACPVVASRGCGPDGKLIAIDPDWVAGLRDAADNVLVEADGAAGRPFKAPAEHEPVIPAAATVVVPVVGVEVLGKPLSAETAHRPEVVAEIGGIRIGDEITARVVANVMLHPRGNAKGAPAAARLVPLINKVDTEERVEAARRIAQELLASGARRVVLARRHADAPVVEALEAP